MKKLLSLLLALVMLCALCACGAEKAEAPAEAPAQEAEPAAEETPAEPETVCLKVWGSQVDQDLLKELCEKFAAEHPEKLWEFEYGVVGEADAQARYLEDPAAAADVFSYPDDQIITLVQADALYEVTRNHDEIVAANAAGKQVHMDISNGWSLASFFLGNGCTLTLDADGKQLCDFNSPAGLEAAEAIRAFCNDPAFITGDDSVLQGGIGDSICAGVSGPWTSAAIKEKLGDNFGAAKLPTFTCGGKQVQMGSFLGCKVLGVNTLSAHPVEAMMLAEFLTNEESQLRRFELLGYGPSNINAAASPAVSADPALTALAEQSAFAISQHVLGEYWTPAEAFGAELEAHSTADLQEMLDQLVAQSIA